MLEVFHHGVIRRFFGINRERVCDGQITNSAPRKKFMNMPKMINIVRRVREDKEEALQKSFLTAYCHSPTHLGGHQK
jgi:hypothetical protein